MKILITDDEFNNSKRQNLIPLECLSCKNTFFRIKKYVTTNINRNGGNFCSKKCAGKSQIKHKTVQCKNCFNTFIKNYANIKRSSNHFCNSSCSAHYNNTHKIYGYRRSKLETYIESKLTKLYPTLEFHFNRKDAISSELDIYIPSLKLAIELNGIFHYKSIYGVHKLEKIQKNDALKIKLCNENDISLKIIDVSNYGNFQEHTAKMFLDAIINHINFHYYR